MKSIFRLIGLISLFFVLIVQSFAIESPVNVKLTSNTDTSVIVTWEPIENAVMYYVYYSKKSGKDGDYEKSSDLVEGNSVEIKGLEKGQNYYFVVTSLDENGEEGVYSNEVMLDFDSSKVTNTDFALKEVSAISYNKIKLTFTDSLDDSEDTIREFRIVNKVNNLDSFEVISSELDSEDDSIIELTLDRDTKIGEQYEVVIVAIKSLDGRNIESGIDNVETFTVAEMVDLNSAGSEEASLVGTNIDASEIENTTLALAEKQTVLPQTGPEHILILILSIIFGALIFIFNYKKA